MRGGDSWHFRVAAEVFILVECKCCLKLIQTKGKQQVSSTFWFDTFKFDTADGDNFFLIIADYGLLSL